MLSAAHGERIRGIATTGKTRLDRALLQRLPALEIVAYYSAGLDNIDTEALAERGIAPRDIAERRLAQMGSTVLRGPSDFYLVWPRYRKSAALQAATNWLLSAAIATE